MYATFKTTHNSQLDQTKLLLKYKSGGGICVRGLLPTPPTQINKQKTTAKNVATVWRGKVELFSFTKLIANNNKVALTWWSAVWAECWCSVVVLSQSAVLSMHEWCSSSESGPSALRGHATVVSVCMWSKVATKVYLYTCSLKEIKKTYIKQI